MSKNRVSVLDQIAGEIAIRIRTWNNERDQLLKAAERVAVLNELISNAESELAEMVGKVDSERAKLPKEVEGESDGNKT